MVIIGWKSEGFFKKKITETESLKKIKDIANPYTFVGTYFGRNIQVMCRRAIIKIDLAFGKRAEKFIMEVSNCVSVSIEKIFPSRGDR